MYTLRSRLALLVLLALLPGLMLILLTSRLQREEMMRDAVYETRQLSQYVVNFQEHFTSNTQVFLANLATTYTLEAFTGDSCYEILSDLMARNPEYANIGIIVPDGIITCSGLSASPNVDVTDRSYFQEIMRTGEFVVGPYLVSRVIGKPTFIYTYPVTNESGDIDLLIYAALNLDWINSIVANQQMPDDAIFTVLDRDGIILAHYPDPDTWVGEIAPEFATMQASFAAHIPDAGDGDHTAQFVGADGVEYFYVFVRLMEPPADGNIYVSTGTPTSVLFARSDTLILQNVLLLLVFALLTIAAIFIGGQVFLLRPINRLVTATRNVAAGDLSTRIHPQNPKSEIEQLALAFDEMAESLEVQTEEVQQKERELSALYSALASLLDSPDLNEVSERVAQAVVEKFGQVNCSVILYDGANNQFTRVAHAGSFGTPVDSPNIAAEDNLITDVVRGQQTIYIPDMARDTRYASPELPTRSALVVPLRTASRVIGVLDLQSPEIDAFDESQRRIVEIFAQRASMIVENAQLYSVIHRYATDLEERVVERTAELNAALEREHELSQEKADFLSMMSHEFRTPLTVIQSASNMLKNYGEHMDEQKRIDYLKRIDAQIHHAIEELDNFLLVNRSEKMELGFAPVALNLAEHCEETIHSIKTTVGGSRSIYFSATGMCEPVMIDKRLFRSILNNLITNAIKYSDEATAIWCELTCSEEDFTLLVRDEGIGIPEDEVKNLFERYFRASNASGISGTGLGLQVVELAVMRHGGQIKVESTVGVGTCFTIVIPRTQPQILTDPPQLSDDI